MCKPWKVNGGQYQWPNRKVLLEKLAEKEKENE